MMDRDEFIGKLQMCYFGERNAFNEIISEYDRLINILNKLEEYCWELKAMGCREGALDMLDKLKALKEDNK